MRQRLCYFSAAFSVAIFLFGCSAPIDIGSASAAGKKFHDRFNQQDYAAIYADAPSTELGRQEWEYFEERGLKRTPGLAETP